MFLYMNDHMCEKTKIYEMMKAVLLSAYEEISAVADEDCVESLFAQEKEFIRLNIDFVKLAFSIINRDATQFKDIIDRLRINLEKLNIPKHIKLWMSIMFLNMLEKYAKYEHCVRLVTYVKRLKDIVLTFFESKKLGNNKDTTKGKENPNQTETEHEQSDFIEFEDFNDDKLRSELKSTRKINAKKWLIEYNIEQEDIDDINESIEEYITLSEVEKNLNEKYLEVSLNTLNTFARFFNETIEFMEFSDVLKDMMVLLNSVYYNISEEKKPLLKALIDSVINDLRKWTEEVLNKKEAIDIHYLDASIYSSIAQIEIMLGDSDETNQMEDEELELF